MTAAEAVKAGRSALRARPLATVVALLAAMAAVLVAMSAARAADRFTQLAIARGSVEPFGRALAVLLAGSAFGGLTLEAARAIALARYARATVLMGLARMPALVTVLAVELAVELMLIVGAATVIVRRATTPATAALLFAPALFLGAWVFLAARVATSLAARGLRPAPALVHGFDVVARRLPSLLRLGARLLLATLPLLAVTLVLTVVRAADPRLALIATLVRAGCFGLAWLWAYASLGEWLGRDPRLVTG